MYLNVMCCVALSLPSLLVAFVNAYSKRFLVQSESWSESECRGPTRICQADSALVPLTGVLPLRDGDGCSYGAGLSRSSNGALLLLDTGSRPKA
jgi:hypothetical protein